MIEYAKREYHVLFVIFLAFSLTLVGCPGSSSDGSGGGGGSTAVSCASMGPGSAPDSGSGTESDPYMMSLGVSYGGCSPAQADPGPVYGIRVDAGSYTVTQTNGVTDLELWIYSEDGGHIDTIDDKVGGYDESGTSALDAGGYGIEVYNNGAPDGSGSQDGPFTLTVTKN